MYWTWSLISIKYNFVIKEPKHSFLCHRRYLKHYLSFTSLFLFLLQDASGKKYRESQNLKWSLGEKKLKEETCYENKTFFSVSLQKRRKKIFREKKKSLEVWKKVFMPLKGLNFQPQKILFFRHNCKNKNKLLSPWH